MKAEPTVITSPTVRKENAFQWLECSACRRRSLHYNSKCCEHSPYPRPPSLGGRVVAEVAEVDRPRNTFTPPKGAMRVRRFCDHFTTHPWRALCAACMTYLRGSLCPECEEYVKPLPACKCQVVYKFEGDEDNLKALCEYCTTPTAIWDLGEAVVGRHGKRRVHKGWDKGVEVVEYVNAFFTRKISACPTCRLFYDEFCRLAEVKARESGKAITGALPER